MFFVGQVWGETLGRARPGGWHLGGCDSRRGASKYSREQKTHWTQPRTPSEPRLCETFNSRILSLHVHRFVFSHCLCSVPQLSFDQRRGWGRSLASSIKRSTWKENKLQRWSTSHTDPMWARSMRCPVSQSSVFGTSFRRPLAQLSQPPILRSEGTDTDV